MNNSELQAAVLRRLNISSTDPGAVAVQDYVNEAIHMVESAHPSGWSYLRRTINFSTTASTSSYSYETISTSSTTAMVTLIHAGRVTVGSEYRDLEALSPSEGIAQFSSPSETGSPEAFWAEGQTVEFYPIPNDAYDVQLRVTIGEPDLSDATDTPYLPSRYHGAIIQGALVCHYQQLQDVNRAQAAGQAFDGWIGRMMTSLVEKTILPRVRVRGSDVW